MRRIPSISLLLLLALACGYRSLTGPGALPDHLRRIELPIWDNRSREPGFERLLADALAEEFTRRGSLAPAFTGGGDLTLRGVVRTVRVRPTSFTSVGLEAELEVTVLLDVELFEASRVSPLWSHDGLELRERFVTSSEGQVYASNKEEALRSIALHLAGRLHDEIIQTF